jgi:hypothetical protein
MAVFQLMNLVISVRVYSIFSTSRRVLRIFLAVYTGYFKDDYSELPVLTRMHEILNQMYSNEGQIIIGMKRPPKP